MGGGGGGGGKLGTSTKELVKLICNCYLLKIIRYYNHRTNTLFRVQINVIHEVHSEIL